MSSRSGAETIGGSGGWGFQGDERTRRFDRQMEEMVGHGLMGDMRAWEVDDLENPRWQVRAGIPEWGGSGGRARADGPGWGKGVGQGWRVGVGMGARLGPKSEGGGRAGAEGWGWGWQAGPRKKGRGTM